MNHAAAVERPHRALAGVIAGQVSLHSAMAGVRMGAPLMLLQGGGLFGLSPALTAGTMVALFAAAPVFTAMHAGRWVDRRGFHRPMRLAVTMAVLGGLLAAPAGVAPWWSAVSAGAADALRALLLSLGAVLMGTAANLTHICAQRTVGRLASAMAEGDDAVRSTELKRMFSWLGLAPSLSNVVGPLLAGMSIDAMGYGTTFCLLAGMPLLTVGFMRWVPEGARSAGPAAPARQARPGVVAGARELLALPGMATLLATNWFFSTAWDLFSFLVPLQGHALGLTATAIGAVLGTFATAVAAIRVLLPALVGNRSEAQVISTCYLTVAAMFLLYPHATTAWQMLALAVPLGAALGAVQPMVMTTLHHITPESRQGEAIALRSMLINLSSAVLPMGYGALGAVLGAATLFRAMAVVLIAGARVSTRLPAPRH